MNIEWLKDEQMEKKANRIVAEFTNNICKNAINDFAKFLILQMNERDYMGVKYKQGVFSDRDIDNFANEFIAKKFGAEVEL